MNERVVKSEIVKDLWTKFNDEGAHVSYAKFKSYIEAFIDVVADEVAQGNKVWINKIGTFSTREQKARRVTLPSGDILDVEAKRSVSFKPCNSLKTRVNDNHKQTVKTKKKAKKKF